MSDSTKRLTIGDIIKHKKTEPLVCLTAYTAPFARILDRHADLLLVGDSLGMVLYGMPTTLSVTLDMMIQHWKAVVNSSKRALIVVDMPFASYQESPELAFRNASQIMAQTGCHAIKLEGGQSMEKTVSFLTKRGIPVMGHIGLMPQHVASYGGYRYQGKSAPEAKQIMLDAKAIEEAGAFSVVIEGVPESLAKKVAHTLNIPVIGIGASVACDGQILVSEDMAGLFEEFTPKFVRRYAQLGEQLDLAAKNYAHDVRNRLFPDEKEVLKN
jgi:3-methyl-2-oxobutanoate hydroxymethyltransferase